MAKRNIVGIAAAYPEIAKQGVLLRKFGQEVIRITAGKRVHGTGAIPGGVNKNLSLAKSATTCSQDIDQIVAWSRDAVQLARAAVRAEPGRSTTTSAASTPTP